jgi:hypothetical protein
MGIPVLTRESNGFASPHQSKKYTKFLTLFESDPSRMTAKTYSCDTPLDDGAFVIWKEIGREEVNQK